MEHNNMLQSPPQALPRIFDQKKAHPPPYPPPTYAQSHEPSATTELPPIQPPTAYHGSGINTLPSLSSVTGTPAQPPYTSPPIATPEQTYSPPPARVTHWPSSNPLTAYYTPSYLQPEDQALRMEVDASSSTTGTLGPASPDRNYDGRAASVSLDDPDVRMAAEALGDLRADFISSPKNRSTPLPGSPANASQQPEPLLSLLTTSHPLLAKTIEGTTSAYNTSKNFSPRFKTSAEYVEGYLTPIGNTLGSVGRVTGVEGGVRWFLRAGRRHQRSRSDLEGGDANTKAKKRRKVSDKAKAAAGDADQATTETDPFGFSSDRRLSMSTVDTLDTLPAYDDYRSPAYTESADEGDAPASAPGRQVAGPAPWQNRLIMSTSGLSIAMSEESLRSLKYCLRWLRWANEHIAMVVAALKAALDAFDKTDAPAADEGATAATDPLLLQQDRGEITARIATLKKDVLKTLRDVIETVSKYAGGALPENAKDLVRRHLTSLPQRFRLAASQTAEAGSSAEGGSASVSGADGDVREGTQKVLVLAKEGLEMMAQVSGVLDGTIVSAEEWCERLGKRRRADSEADMSAGTQAQQPSVVVPALERDGDVVMQ